MMTNEVPTRKITGLPGDDPYNKWADIIEQIDVKDDPSFVSMIFFDGTMENFIFAAAPRADLEQGRKQLIGALDAAGIVEPEVRNSMLIGQFKTHAPGGSEQSTNLMLKTVYALLALSEEADMSLKLSAVRFIAAQRVGTELNVAAADNPAEFSQVLARWEKGETGTATRH